MHFEIRRHDLAKVSNSKGVPWRIYSLFLNSVVLDVEWHLYVYIEWDLLHEKYSRPYQSANINLEWMVLLV